MLEITQKPNPKKGLLAQGQFSCDAEGCDVLRPFSLRTIAEGFRTARDEGWRRTGWRRDGKRKNSSLFPLHACPECAAVAAKTFDIHMESG